MWMSARISGFWLTSLFTTGARWMDSNPKTPGWNPVKLTSSICHYSANPHRQYDRKLNQKWLTVCTSLKLRRKLICVNMIQALSSCSTTEKMLWWGRVHLLPYQENIHSNLPSPVGRMKRIVVSASGEGFRGFSASSSSSCHHSNRQFIKVPQRWYSWLKQCH